MFHVKHSGDTTRGNSVSVQCNTLRTLTEKSNIQISENGFSQFERYIDAIFSRNKKLNLISRNDMGRIAYRHIFESLLLTKAFDFSGTIRLLDFGSGGGFPGIPLKIWNPYISLVLVESIEKKCRFLSNTVSDLGLSDTTVACSRIEDLSGDEDFRDGFDVVTARAVAKLSSLADFAEPFTGRFESTGHCIFPKGSGYSDELDSIDREKWNVRIENLSGYLPDTKNKDSNLYCVVLSLVQ